jgi:hypothetical protein
LFFKRENKDNKGYTQALRCQWVVQKKIVSKGNPEAELEIVVWKERQ